jgi:hypothetical protein
MGEKPTEVDEQTERRVDKSTPELMRRAGGGGEAERYLKMEGPPEIPVQGGEGTARGTFLKVEREAGQAGADPSGLAVSDPGAGGSKGDTTKK